MSLASTYKTLLDPANDSFSKYVIVSAVLHISVVLFFTVKVFLFPGEPLAFQSALRVDLVALPDKISAPAPVPAPAPVAAPAPSQPVAPPKAPAKPADDTAALNPKTRRYKARSQTRPQKAAAEQQRAIDRLKQMSAIEKLGAGCPAGSGRQSADL